MVRHRVSSPDLRRRKRRADSSDSDGYFQAPLVVRPMELRVSPLRDERAYRSPDTKEYKHAHKKRRPPSEPPSDSSSEGDDESGSQSESTSGSGSSDSESGSESGSGTGDESGSGSSGGSSSSSSSSSSGSGGGTESGSGDDDSRSGSGRSESAHNNGKNSRRQPNEKPPQRVSKHRSRSPAKRRLSPAKKKLPNGQSSPSRKRNNNERRRSGSPPARSPDRRRNKNSIRKRSVSTEQRHRQRPSNANGRHRKETSSPSRRGSHPSSRRDRKRSRDRRKSPPRRQSEHKDRRRGGVGGSGSIERKQSPPSSSSSAKRRGDRGRGESPRRRGSSPSRREARDSSAKRSRGSSPHRSSRKDSPRRRSSPPPKDRDDSRDKGAAGQKDRRDGRGDGRRSSPRNGRGGDDRKGERKSDAGGDDSSRRSNRDAPSRGSQNDKGDEARGRNGKRQESEIRKSEEPRDSGRIKPKQEKLSPVTKVKEEPATPERSKWETDDAGKSSSLRGTKRGSGKGDSDHRRSSATRGGGTRSRADDLRRRNRDAEEPDEKFEWGKSEDKTEDEPNPEDKKKADLALSGKLAEDTNVFNGVVVKYNEPSEAKKPKRRWRLYVFKGEESLPFIPLHRQSAYLIGRDRKVADIPIDHPSCSKQHAVLQYRSVAYERSDGSTGRRVRPYVIDLESANGTFVNNKRVDARRFVELFEQDVIKFGFSSREYVILPEDAGEAEQKEDGAQEAAQDAVGP